MLRVLALAVSIAATSALASDGRVPQTIEGDFENYIHFVWARSICTGFEVNYHRAMMQILILGEAMGLTEVEALGKVGLESEQAMLSYQADAYAYCANLREIFRSYDPEHLLRAGITPGRFP